MPGPILPTTSPENWGRAEIRLILDNTTTWAIYLVGGIAVIMIIWGAIQYLTAFGNEEKAATGKKIITWALIGLVVILLAGVIVQQILNLVQ